MSKPIIAPSLLSANFLDLRGDIDKINSSVPVVKLHLYIDELSFISVACTIVTIVEK